MSTMKYPLIFLLCVIAVMVSACAPLPEKYFRDEQGALPGKEEDMGLAGTMVLVLGGCYRMGDLYGKGAIDEIPVHKVCVDDFYIGKYEVTQRQWSELMGNNPSTYSDCEDCPVERVSWDDALEFARKLNEKTGMKFRLPTEAEWEYACREAGREVKFGTGKDTIGTDEANFRGDVYRKKTIAVGSFSPNALGLHDMSGNVWEWTQDSYKIDAYKEHGKKNPVYVDDGVYRVVRGGGFRTKAVNQRCSNRASISHDFSWRYIGFRLVRTR